MYNKTILLVFVISMTISWCYGQTSINEQLSDNKNGNFFNYLRLPDGQCYNCSTYKCTNHKANLGGSEWCIMLFRDAVAHCDSDPNCGGYTMTTAEWFHKRHDKKGEVAVHLTKVGEKPIICPEPEWSSYEKQKAMRDTPITYGRSTCGNSAEATCTKSNNFNYVFVSNSNAAGSDVPYLCKNHPNNLDNKNLNCILPIVDGVTLCNSDDQCEGFVTNTDEKWQKKFSHNGLQGVQLVGQGATYTPSQTWRSFKKQQ